MSSHFEYISTIPQHEIEGAVGNTASHRKEYGIIDPFQNGQLHFSDRIPLEIEAHSSIPT